MRKKLTYVLLATLFVTGNSAFAMMGDEEVSRYDFKILKSTALHLLNTDETLEVRGHHYKVTGKIEGTTGNIFTTFITSPSKDIINFHNHTGNTGGKTKQWKYIMCFPPTIDDNPKSPTFSQKIGRGVDGIVDLQITQID